MKPDITHLYQKILDYCKYLTHDDGEDLCQDTYLKALTFMSKNDRDYEEWNLEAWLKTIAKNTQINAQRGDHFRGLVQEFDNQWFTTNTPDREFKFRSESDQVRSWLKSEPEWKTTIFELYYVRDLSMREISRELGIPLGTVKSRLARLRKSLKGTLNPDLGSVL